MSTCEVQESTLATFIQTCANSGFRQIRVVVKHTLQSLVNSLLFIHG